MKSPKDTPKTEPSVNNLVHLNIAKFMITAMVVIFFGVIVIGWVLYFSNPKIYTEKPMQADDWPLMVVLIGSIFLAWYPISGVSKFRVKLKDIVEIDVKKEDEGNKG